MPGDVILYDPLLHTKNLSLFTLYAEAASLKSYSDLSGSPTKFPAHTPEIPQHSSNPSDLDGKTDAHGPTYEPGEYSSNH